MEIDAGRLGKGLARQALATVRATSHPAVIRRLAALEAEMEGLLSPRASVRMVAARMEGRDCLRLDGGLELRGGFVNRFAGASGAAVVFATLGDAYAEHTSACFAQGKAVEAALYDQVGSKAVWRLGQRILAGLRLAARRDGKHAGGPLFPGDPGLPLSAQSVLAEIGAPAAAGVAVVAGGLLSPLKSLSMVVAVGDGMRRWSRASSCRECKFFERCRKPAETRKACR